MTGLFDIGIQVAGGALLAILMVLIYRRKLHRSYPFFTAYITYAFVEALALLCVTASYKMYFWTYWVGECGGIVLTLLALYEVFRDVFELCHQMWWFRLIFPAAVAALSTFFIWRAMLAPAPYAPRVMYVIFAMDSAVSYVQAGVFFLFLALILGLRVPWRRYPFGIALGFAVSSMGTLMSYILFTEFGIRYVHMAKYASPIFFILGNLLWLWMVAGKAEPEPNPRLQLPSERLTLRVCLRMMKGDSTDLAGSHKERGAGSE